MGGVERRRDHVVELQVRLDVRLVEIMARLAHLLGVIAPVPGGELEIPAFRIDRRLQRIALSKGTGLCRRPDLVEQAARGGWRLRHRVGKPVFRVARVAEQLRLLGPQRHDFGDDAGIVVHLAAGTARHPGVEQLLA